MSPKQIVYLRQARVQSEVMHSWWLSSIALLALPIAIDLGGCVEQSDSEPLASVREGRGAELARTGQVVEIALPAARAQPSPINRSLFEMRGSDAAADARFGSSLSASNGALLVGAPGDAGGVDDAGSAYVFLRNAESWTEQVKLLPSGPGALAAFGQAVALDGSYALIGAPAPRDDALIGAAYLFERNASAWQERAILTPSGGAAGDEFGSSVGLRGQWAFVGALKHDAGSADAGAVYVFERQANVWSQSAKLTASDPTKSAGFGVPLVLGDGRALLGAVSADGVKSLAGAAYVFERSASAWQERAKLTADDGENWDRFAVGLSLLGDDALIGASGDDNGGIATGSAYAFQRQAAGWVQVTRLEASDASVASSFGRSVALTPTQALVGAFTTFINSLPGAGAGYVFSRTATTWVEGQKVERDVPAEGDQMGWALAVDGDQAFVGAPRRDAPGVDAGAVFRFGLRTSAAGCADDWQCLSGACSAGVCCDSACIGACEACDLVGMEGSCRPRPASTDVAACSPFRCDGGSTSCLTACSGDSECASGFRCDSGACIAQLALGNRCRATRDCLSAHCVDGLCCDSACDGGCDRCDAANQLGRCEVVAQGTDPDGVCSPYLCDGSSASCAAACSGEAGCGQGWHCEDARCVADLADGEVCQSAEMCRADFCTDGRCCVATQCAPYRCGKSGVCELRCQSSAQCAPGHQCSSEGACVSDEVPASNAQSGSCSVGLAPARSGQTLMLSLLLMLLGGITARRRRAGKSPEAEQGPSLVGVLWPGISRWRP